MPGTKKLVSLLAAEAMRAEARVNELRRDVTTLERECERWREKLSMYRKAMDDIATGDIAVVQKIVCEEFEIQRALLLSHRRHKRLTEARQIAFWLCKQCSPRSLGEIARQFGNRDHTTILHGVRKMENALSESPQAATLLMRLKARVDDEIARKKSAPADPSCQPIPVTNGRSTK